MTDTPEPDADAPKTQAQRIIARFGGPYRLAAALAAVGYSRDPSNIYRWTYPRHRGGTDGLVPNKAWAGIRAAARAEGIFLRSSDFDPREF